MTDQDQTTQLSGVDQAYINEERLRIEGLAEPGRSMELSALAELAGGLILPNAAEVVELDAEMDAAEQAQAEAARHIAEARQLAAGSREKDKHATTVEINFDKIGFINREGVLEVNADEVHTDELDYILVDLISLNPTTREQFEKLKNQSTQGSRNLGEELIETVKEVTIPKLDENIRKGKDLRPISAGNRTRSQMKAQQSLNTSYPAYKEGVHATKNRAIIMKLEDQGDKPVYGLVALYDHDDDRSIHRNLFLKQK